MQEVLMKVMKYQDTTCLLIAQAILGKVVKHKRVEHASVLTLLCLSNMQVNKHFFLGEALYRLSVYEKGRCNPGKIRWTKEYVTQLVNSIELMSEIVQSLSDEDITFHDYETIRKSVESRDISYFNEALLKQWQESNYSLSSIHDLSPYKEVNQLMNNIIEQLKQTMESLKKSFNKKNKEKIWFLLQAFHNLPKVYLSTQQESVFKYQSFPITVYVALECAQIYLKMVD